MKRDAPIIAEYLGGAVNCDAYHMTDPRADGLGVSTCIESSLKDAGVAREEVFLSGLGATLLILNSVCSLLESIIYFCCIIFFSDCPFVSYIRECTSLRCSRFPDPY